MLQKSKNYKKSNQVARHASRVGIAMMALAATIVAVEVPHQEEHAAVPNTHAAHHANAGNAEGKQDIRREKEETGPHFTSYGVQRTPPRAGHI